jgi:uncharacterized protein (TIGR02147 family)
MNFDSGSMRVLLIDELRKRQENNGLYSLRSFSRSLSIDPSLLSKLLRGERTFSAKISAQIQLKIPKIKSNIVNSDHAMRDRLVRITNEEYRIASDWQAFAVLELTSVSHFVSSIPWIAHQLSINETECLECVRRLERLGWLDTSSAPWKDRLGPACAFVSPESPPIVEKTRKHAQIQLLAQKALLELPYEKREFSGITIAAGTEDLAYLRKEIQKFQRKLMRAISQNKNKKTGVIQIQCAAFPLTQSLKD